MSVVAVVDADAEVRRETVRALEEADFTAVAAEDGLAALRTVYSARPQAVLTDLHVPGLGGLELIRVLRAACDVPILVLASGATPKMTASALDTGADDVLDKPCSGPVLVARLRAAIRRYDRQVNDREPGPVVRTGALAIDRETRTVTRHGEPVRLTRTEYRLLEALASHVGQVAPHRLLLSVVWGDAYVDETHYLRVYMGYLRSKLEDDPCAPRYLLNEWGTGYRLAQLAIELAPEGEPSDEPSNDDALQRGALGAPAG